MLKIRAAQDLNNKKTELKFGALPYRDNEIMKSYVNLSEISKLGWYPKLRFEDGLEKTIKLEQGKM